MEYFNASDSWNATEWNKTLSVEAEPGTSLLKKFHDILVLCILIVIMFSMGCLITPKQIWKHLRAPIGVGIGVLSQFLVMPLTAFCLFKALKVPVLQATGMLILATCPGGTTSNVFTYMVDGNVALSVTMTTVSTLLALGMMPLNLWIYGSHMSTTNEGLVIPYGKIGISLAAVTVPLVFGMLFKWKVPTIAGIVSKTGSYFGLLLILLVLVLEIILYPDIFYIVTWQLYVCLLLLPVLSLCLGYGVAWICRRPMDERKTVAIECSVQNVGLSITIITMSFPLKFQKNIIAFSYMYPIPSIATMAATVLIYKLWKSRTEKGQQKEANGHVMTESSNQRSEPKSDVKLLANQSEAKSPEV